MNVLNHWTIVNLLPILIYFLYLHKYTLRAKTGKKQNCWYNTLFALKAKINDSPKDYYQPF